jgi:hypothetical protein
MKSSCLYIALACALAGVFASCGSSKEMAASGTSGVKKVACGKVAMEPDVPHIDWFESDGRLAKAKDLNLPAAYNTYVVEETQLKRFFEVAAAGDVKQVKTVVPLGTTGCQVFHVKRSGTMSPGLAEKYPELVSLSGTGEKGTGDLRLDFDGKKMSGQVIWKNDIYLVSPIEYSNRFYYIIYKKSDAMEEKQPFESATK